MKPRRPVREPAWTIAAAGAVLAVAVIAMRNAPSLATTVPQQPSPSGQPLPDPNGADGPPRNDAWELRLLLTIIAGVALGAAATALPSLMAMTTSMAPKSVVCAWLLWVAGFFAVILTYLATLTGSKLLLNRIDLVHTASLIAVFLTECALFATFSLADNRTFFRFWFASFGVFSAMACCTIMLIVWKLSEWWQVDRLILPKYREGQLADAAISGTTGALSMAYAITFPDPDGPMVVFASGAALLVMVLACLKQAAERKRMRGQGLI